MTYAKNNRFELFETDLFRDALFRETPYSRKGCSERRLILGRGYSEKRPILDRVLLGAASVEHSSSPGALRRTQRASLETRPHGAARDPAKTAGRGPAPARQPATKRPAIQISNKSIPLRGERLRPGRSACSLGLKDATRWPPK